MPAGALFFFLFSFSNHYCALDPVLRQIHSKHSDRCIHKAALGAPECAPVLRWTICQPKTCQGSRSYIHRVGEVKVERRAENKIGRYEAS